MNALKGRAVLVVEDEYFVAKDLKRVLEKRGAKVIGPAPSVDTGIELIETTPDIDGAILDVNLGGEMAFPAADLLVERSVPFVFTTGYDESVIPARFASTKRCEKPIDAERVCRMLADAFG